MVIGSKQKVCWDKQLTHRLNETVLENVTCHKVLGVIIDNNFNWHKHIDYVCKALNNKISLLKHILYYLTNEMKLLFYNAYLLPIFDNCCTIWGKTNKRYINKILIIQKRAAKLILNKPTRTPTDGLFKQLRWLTFTDRCKYHTALLVYKTLNYMAPSYMSDIITVSTNNSYSLRSALRNDLVLKHKPKTRYIKDSFNYYTVWQYGMKFQLKSELQRI